MRRFVSGLIACEELFDISVVFPTRQQHFIRRKRCECTTSRAAAVIHRRVIYGECFDGQNVLKLQLRTNGLGPKDPESQQPVEHRQPRAYNGVDSIFEIARSGERHCPKKIGILDFPFYPPPPPPPNAPP